MSVLYSPNRNLMVDKHQIKAKYVIKIHVGHFKLNVLKGCFWVYAWTFDTTYDDEDAIKNVTKCYYENQNWKDPKYKLSWDLIISSGN